MNLRGVLAPTIPGGVNSRWISGCHQQYDYISWDLATHASWLVAPTREGLGIGIVAPILDH